MAEGVGQEVVRAVMVVAAAGMVETVAAWRVVRREAVVTEAADSEVVRAAEAMAPAVKGEGLGAVTVGVGMAVATQAVAIVVGAAKAVAV